MLLLVSELLLLQSTSGRIYVERANHAQRLEFYGDDVRASLCTQDNSTFRGIFFFFAEVAQVFTAEIVIDRCIVNAADCAVTNAAQWILP